MAIIRRIPFKNVNNFRDIGGYATKDGMAVKWRRLYRCDSLSNLKKDEWEMFERLNIRTVIDLRSKAEIKNSPDNLPKNIRYYRCPLQEELRESKDNTKNSAKEAMKESKNSAKEAIKESKKEAKETKESVKELKEEKMAKDARDAFELSMGAGYLSILHDNAKLLTAAVMTVCDTLKKGNVVFHCTAGKDRTGVLAAVILTLLGVRKNDIIADYEISHTLNQKFNKMVLKEMPDVKEKMYILDSKADDMRLFLDELKKVKIEQYLIDNGGMRDRIQYLRDEMREEIE